MRRLRMDTTQLLKGVLDLAVLAVVSERDGYGYDVVRRLRAAGWTTWATPRSTGRCGGSTAAAT
jgi:DNA-binding PadR family transcriptional regulator